MKAVILALLLNAHALGNNEVWHELDDRFSQLPEYMMDQIIAAAESGLTGADVVRMYISHYNNQYQYALQQRLYYRLTDTTGYFTADSVVVLLSEAQGPRALSLLAQIALTGGDSTWHNALDTKLSTFSGYDSHLNAVEAWYNQWVENMQNAGYYDEADSTLTEALEEWLHANGTLGGKAMGILSWRGELEYEEPVLIPIDLENKRGSNKTAIKTSGIEIQPNPANDFVNIYYYTDKIKEQKELVLMDFQGKELLRTPVTLSEDQVLISVAAFPNGVYMLVLYADGVSVCSERLIIQR